MSEWTGSRVNVPRLIVGVAVIGLGIAFMLHNLHIVRIRSLWRLIDDYWPLVLVAVGVAQIVQAKTWTGYAGGTIWMLVGAWLLGDSLGFIDISIWSLWPVLLVLFGAWVLLNGIRPPGTRGRSTGPTDGRPDDTVGALAIMSGVTRKSIARDFRGGDVIAFMGGATIDLRGATIASGEARLEVFVMWGGIDLFVPEGWAVENKVLPFMGGVDDQTSRPVAEQPPRLVVRGLVVMGGMDIKH